MRLLHTSDWHLGRPLFNYRRYEEFEAFLNWLAEVIRDRRIDVLVVAGDIFDTTAPANKAQELYYRFLAGLMGSCCRNVVIIGGNHDSPTFLDAPKQLLRALNVHVVGSMPADSENENILLKTPAGEPFAVVCAVPYLRDKDIRTVEAGESIEEKGERLLQGIRGHYASVCAAAEKIRKELSGEIPLITTGHLFTAGGRTIDDDGVKELYVGALAHAPVDIFPEFVDYCALGHLHVAQKVAGHEHIRYSGSPLPMGFGEAGQQKQVVFVEFSGRKPHIEEIAVPCFRPLVKVSGTFAEIAAELHKLIAEKSNAWVDVEYTGQEILPSLQEDIFAMVAGSDLALTRVRIQRLVRELVGAVDSEESLDDLNEAKVFDLCLEFNDVCEEQRTEMIAAFNEILALCHEEDLNRE